MFSIIIPTFNAEKTLSKALDTVISQTFYSCEILIIDGGSNDNTLNILKTYAGLDSRITWASEKDEGIYDAMNKGIRRAKGEWLFFLGADDSFYNSDVLSKINKSIDENKSATLVYGNVQCSEPFSGYLIYAGKFDSAKLLRINICHQSIFYHKSIFQKFGWYNTKYKMLADWDFNLRCFNSTNHFFLDTIIANYSVTGISMQVPDLTFKEDLLENMALNYPYNYRNAYFKNKKSLIVKLLLDNIKSFRLKRSLRLFKIAFYHSVFVD